MRLLMTTDAVGGVWTYSCELTRGMLARGASVLLAVVGPGLSDDQAEWMVATAERWPAQFVHRHVGVPLEWMDDGAGCYTSSEAAMLALCDEFRPDVLHCNQFCYGALPAFRGGSSLPKMVVAHSDVLSWWHARYGVAVPSSTWKMGYLEQVKAGLTGADIVVAPTAASLAELQDHFDCDADTHALERKDHGERGLQRSGALRGQSPAGDDLRTSVG